MRHERNRNRISDTFLFHDVMFNTYSVFRFVKPTNILLWTSLILFSDSNLKSNIISHCQLLSHLLSTTAHILFCLIISTKTEADVDKDYEARIDQETVRCDIQTLGKIWRHKKKTGNATHTMICTCVSNAQRDSQGASKWRYQLNNHERDRDY
jgi:hypothetical protein